MPDRLLSRWTEEGESRGSAITLCREEKPIERGENEGSIGLLPLRGSTENGSRGREEKGSLHVRGRVENKKGVLIALLV